MGKKLKDVLFILVLGSVCTFALLGIKSYTYPKILRYEELEFKTTILDAAKIKYSARNLETVFDQNIRQVKTKELVYYLSPDNFYIFEFIGRGLWGPIRGVITLRQDLETIEGLRIISQEETPGLGGRISEESFLSTFEDKKFSPRLELVLRRKATKENEIDAISGASMTSAALVEMINDTVEVFRKAIKK